MMNKEKIIANIEKYISTAREKEQTYYYSGLEQAGDTPIKKAFKNVNEPIFELAEIVQELRREIKEQAQKETRGNSYVKRSRLITKLLAKSYREEFAKGFYEEINGEKYQCCIINGFYVFMLRDTLDIPMIADNVKSTLSIARMIPDYKHFESCTVDIAEAKTALKMHKAKCKSKRGEDKHTTQINNKYYDTEFLINVVDGLGGEIKLYQSDKAVTPDIFESENGLAILCPVRPPRQI